MTEVRCGVKSRPPTSIGVTLKCLKSATPQWGLQKAPPSSVDDKIRPIPPLRQASQPKFREKKVARVPAYTQEYGLDYCDESSITTLGPSLSGLHNRTTRRGHFKMAQPAQGDGPVVKRQKVRAPAKPSNASSATASTTATGSRIFAPFRVSYLLTPRITDLKLIPLFDYRPSDWYPRPVFPSLLSLWARQPFKSPHRSADPSRPTILSAA